MKWETLLSLRRFGDTHKRIRKEQDETRLGFEVDYDRVIFSSDFRSLQDKTQVIPMSETDFVHTRLTHSLEVSVVGRSLGRQVGKKVLEKHPHLEHSLGYKFNDFGAIVAADSLAHDIGNPPFGHSGEKAIGEFFSSGWGTQFKSQLLPKEYQDLCDFEGNANGFKLLTESKNGVSGGLRLSYATLGAFMKYPKESLPKKPTSHISDKKFGVFQSDLPAFKEVVEEIGLIQSRKGDDISYARHPLCYLVEAADDICYTIIDFEDGINLGWISEDLALEYLIKLVKDSINTKKYNSLSNTKDRISYLRALSINTLIGEAVSVFMKNEDSILAGTYSKALLDSSNFEAQINDIIKVSVEKVYKSPEVIQKEISGYQVLQGLLEVYCKALHNYLGNNLTNYDKLIFNSLSNDLKFDDGGLYENLIRICNYVAKLSDRKALSTYKRYKGESF